MYRKFIPFLLVLVLSACSTGSKWGYDSTYKFLEHSGDTKHSPQELYQECMQINKEIAVLKVKADTVKGPGFEMARNQIEKDIKWLRGKYDEAECDKAVSSPPQPAAEEEKAHESQATVHDHESQPAVHD
ncbi:MAG: hypothetical protein AB1499_18850, partial [Nitrospirota bacterium]